MDKKNQQILVISAVVAVISVIVIGMIVVQKLERVVQVAERTEDKLNRIIEAASPVGKAAVEKGVSVLNNVDEKELADSAEQGVKEVGAVAKDKLLKWIDAQKASPTNREIPNLNITIKAEETE
jgi:hypothetical protein